MDAMLHKDKKLKAVWCLINRENILSCVAHFLSLNHCFTFLQTHTKHMQICDVSFIQFAKAAANYTISDCCNSISCNL